MSAERATQLHPTSVTYRGHSIKLTHRPPTNDWLYTVIHTSILTITDHEPRYDTAVREAKRIIDSLEDRPRD